MAIFIDRKYLLIVSVKLENFKQKKDDLYNFRCPICGDSSKKKTKSRGFIYKKDNDYFYKCFNDSSCSTTFYKFLEIIDSGLAKEYSLERYRNGDVGHHNYEKPKLVFSKPIFKKNQINLPTISSLSDEHIAKQYIKERKIPVKFHKNLFFAENFKEFVFSIKPDYEKTILEEPRIIIPFNDENGNLNLFQGRSLNNTIRYVTVKLNDSPKIFGLDRVDKRNLIYVLESPLDSLFIKNAVAVADANLEFALKYFEERHEQVNVVLVPDIQPRNLNIVKNIQKWISLNYNVCLLPPNLKGKDINELIQNGLSKQKIEQLLLQYTFNGLRAKLEFQNWKLI